MYQGDFMQKKTEEKAWEILEELFGNTLHWESFNDKPALLNATSNNDIHFVKTPIDIETKIAALMLMIEALESSVLLMAIKPINYMYSTVITVKHKIINWKNVPCWEIH